MRVPVEFLQKGQSVRRPAHDGKALKVQSVEPSVNGRPTFVTYRLPVTTEDGQVTERIAYTPQWMVEAE